MPNIIVARLSSLLVHHINDIYTDLVEGECWLLSGVLNC